MNSKVVLSNPEVAEIPVVILAGGKGIFVDDSGTRKSKGEVNITGQPLIGHVLNIYLDSGFRRFIVSGGYRMDSQVKELVRCFSMQEKAENKFIGLFKEFFFEIQFINSGENTLTGDRLFALKELLSETPRFCMTYSDTISTVNVKQIYSWHLKNKRTVTLMGVKLPTRFRVLGIRSGESLIRGFADRTFLPSHLINGGFYVIESKVWSYFRANATDVVFETDILEQLLEKNELESFSFSGRWQYIDSERDLPGLETVARELAP